MNARATVTVRGTVQGVGYREVVARTARSFGLKGYVMNLKNGTVKIIAEGPKDAIGRFLEGININNVRIQVDEMKKTFSRPRNRFSNFHIRFRRGLSDDTIEIIERLNSGLVIMDRMDGDIKTMNSDIKSMDSHIGAHFEKLDQKYDRFGNTLSGAARDIRAMGRDTRTMKGDMKAVRGDIRGMRGDIGHVRSDMHGLASPRRRKKA
jgi:acylphosphatase